MTRRFRVHIVMAALLVVSAAVSAAPQQPPAEKPPLLSTVPSPPAGVETVPADMSGQPLQVGDLPPGVLVIRVIRRSFAENLSGERVRIQVEPELRSLEATTDQTGRARFDGLRVGDRVRVAASVDGEALGSNSFVIPAEGGVRMLLVAGVGARGPVEVVSLAATDSQPRAEPARQSSQARSLVSFDAASVAITLFAIIAAAILWSVRSSGRKASARHSL
jgi:hypothetical protein